MPPRTPRNHSGDRVLRRNLSRHQSDGPLPGGDLVKRKPVTNLSASVGDRLRAVAKTQGEQLQNVLNRYAVERWLYRLSQSRRRDQFVLKGAMLFTLWSEEPHRKTRDLDLLGFGEFNIPEWEEIFREICRVEVEPDGLEMLA